MSFGASRSVISVFFFKRDERAAIDQGQRTTMSTSSPVSIPPINSRSKFACSQKIAAQLSSLDGRSCVC